MSTRIEYGQGPRIEIPIEGPCFKCGAMRGPGSYCVPCKGFVCWVHRTSRRFETQGAAFGHSRCDHG